MGINKKWVFSIFVIVLVCVRLLFPNLPSFLLTINGAPNPFELFLPKNSANAYLVVIPSEDACDSCLISFQETTVFNDLQNTFEGLEIVFLVQHEGNEDLVNKLEYEYNFSSSVVKNENLHLLRDYLHLSDQSFFVVLDKSHKVLAILPPYRGDDLKGRVNTYLHLLGNL